jgi:hypothetical protein
MVRAETARQMDYDWPGAKRSLISETPHLSVLISVAIKSDG